VTEHVLTELHDHTLTVRLNRPDRKNALTHEMYTALGDAMEQAEQNDQVRCVLFCGNEDCFTAGNDLGEFARGLPGAFRETPVGRFLFLLASATKPVLAAVNGPAVGIGTTMLLHCDMVVAGNNTRFLMPFTNLGLSPEGGSSLLLPDWLGRVRAAELLMLGDAFTAEEAKTMGLINRVCPPEDTENQARALCDRLSAQPPAAIRATKEMLNRATRDSLKETMLAEGERFAQRLQSDEAAEAFAAFREKRKPDFSRFS
jgi:enoyl-CoA hydratase/carnithine racemase